MSVTPDAIANILVDRFEVERSEITPDSTLDDLKLDSLAIVDLQLVLEERYNVSIDGEAITPADSLPSVAQLVNERAEGDPDPAE